MATVKISQGALRGAKRNTESGFEYFEFLGIPYAKPPIGDLRFKSPQSPDSWENERDATKFDKNNISCQIVSGTGKFLGSEDCLYLNVYTPKLANSGDLLPVLFYIHGGGYVSGNGTNKSENGPDFLVENNVVVVSINYRLGVFGFMTLDIPEATGNMGLKDQRKALQWVKDNINQFGGNRNDVTVMGISAGAASVEYLMLSPSTRGLFHKGILQSGSVLNHWVNDRQLIDLTKLLLKSLDYKGSFEDRRAVYEFLLTIPTKKLAQAASKATINHSSLPLSFGFVPTIEKDFGNDDAFLTKNPYLSIKEGDFSKVPLIKTFCNREGIVMRLSKPRDVQNVAEDKKFMSYWPRDVDLHDGEAYNAKLANAYLKETGKEVEELAEDFFADLDFVAGVWLTAKFMSKHVPVYVCQFNYEGNINYFKEIFRTKTNGTLHSDDISYLWKVDALNNADANDILVRRRMTKMFTDFAKTGEPVPVTTDLIPVAWPTFTEDSPTYLSVNVELSHKADYEKERMALFGELYEKYWN